MLGSIAVNKYGRIGRIEEIQHCESGIKIYRGRSFFGGQPWKAVEPRCINGSDADTLLAARNLAIRAGAGPR